MENLEIIQLNGFKIDGNTENVEQVLVFTNGFAVYRDGKLIVYNKILNNENIIYSHGNDENIIKTRIRYLQIEHKLWFGTRKSFYFYDLHQLVLEKIDIEFSYHFATWNPTEDTLIVVNDDYSVTALMHDPQFHTFTVYGTGHVDDVPKGSNVVGWGSEETQYRGPLTKKDKKNTIIEEGVIPKKDVISISWQANGEYYALNYFHEQNRIFKVFKFPADVCYASQHTVGLQHVVAWRPVRNMIATYIQTTMGASIGFFEKNGQIFSTFKLNKNYAIVELKWSTCGNILLLHQEDDMQRHYLNLYTTKNSNWYLKQCLEFPSNTSVLSTEFLDTEENIYKFRVNLNTHILEYTYRATIHKSDGAVCGVISGNELHLTDFSKAVLPPPYALLIIEAANPINFVVFDRGSNLVIIIDSKNIAYWYEIDDEIKKIKVANLSQSDNSWPLAFMHFVWNNNKISCNYSGQNFEKMLAHFDLNIENELFIMTVVTEAAFQAVALSENGNCVITQALNTEISTILDLFNYTTLYPESEPAHTIAGYYLENNLYIFYRTTKDTFYINNIKVASDINSFIFHYNYILLSKSNGKLCGIKLDVDELDLVCKKRDINEWIIREIEQGSILICGIKNTTKIILQMPRGNLEMIRFHLVGVLQVENLLKDLQWKAAVDLIRLDKLNNDLLIDLNPNRFLNNVDNFINSIKSAKVINSILLELQDVNVLKTTYKACKLTQIYELSNKKKAVCDAICEYVKTVDCVTYISTIIICYYIKEDFSTAFQFITKFLVTKQFDLAREAMNVMLLYLDRTVVFNLALETYNVELIEFVAKNSHMDPLEYEHILKQIMNVKGNIESYHEIRFVINNYLEKPKLAIYNLMFQENMDVNRVFEYVSEHALYKEAFTYFSLLYTRNMYTNEFKRIAQEYGLYLKNKRYYEESGNIFAKADLFENAYNSYKLALNWRNAFFMLHKSNLPKDSFEKVYQLIALELSKANRFKEASEIYYEFCKSFDQALNVLISNDLIEDAINLTKKCNYDHVLNTKVYPALIDYTKKLFKILNTLEEQIENYTFRLKTVRQKKILEFHKKEELDIQDYSDLMSESESVATSYSRKSNRSNVSTGSARNRRKKELKKQDLREGGVYEDIALIRIIHISITEVISLTKDVQKTCMLLLDANIEYYDLANQLQKKLLKLYQKISKYSIDVWPSYLYNAVSCTEEEIVLKANFQELDELFHKAPILPNTQTWISILLDT